MAWRFSCRLACGGVPATAWRRRRRVRLSPARWPRSRRSARRTRPAPSGLAAPGLAGLGGLLAFGLRLAGVRAVGLLGCGLIGGLGGGLGGLLLGVLSTAAWRRQALGSEASG